MQLLLHVRSVIHVNTCDSAKGYFVSSRGGGGISVLPVLCLIVLRVLILVLVNFVMQPKPYS